MAFAALTIDLNARLAKFEQDLSKAGRSMDGLNSRAAALSSSLKTVFAGVGVAGIAAFAKAGIDAADALNDLSSRTGVAVKDLASLDLAAKLSDTSLEAVGKALQRLNLSVGQAQGGSKEIAKALTDLGVTSSDARERLFQLADAYKASGGQGQVLADIQKVLGKSYTELIPLLEQGGEGMRQLARESESFAESMARLAPDAAKLNDQLDIMRQNAAAASASILSKLVPSFNEWIAVGREVIKTGTLLDKIRFFGLGNASDEITNRVRKAAQAAAAASAAARKAAADSTTTIKFPAAALPRSRAATKPKLDEIDPFYRERTAALKAAADEVAETERLIAEHLKSTNDELFAQAQAWTEAGRALESEMRTPLENANIEFARLDDLLQRGVITWETYSRAVFKVTESLEEVPEKFKEMDNFAKTAAENIQNSFADFLFNPFENGLKGMAQSFGQLIQRMIAEAVAADLAKKLFGGLVAGGSGSGVAGGLLSGLGGLLGFANGGIMSSNGSMPLKRYASGGIASMPQLALFGEGSMNEAYVPLPDGRSIPVKMNGGGGSTIIVNVNGSNNAPDVRRAAGQGAREALMLMNGAKRYA